MATEKQKNRIKLTTFSQFIFNTLQQAAVLDDQILMDKALTRFGKSNQKTIVRRKYDVVNVLQMADILQVKKNQSGEIVQYLMRHQVPNSINDLEAAKQKVTHKQNILELKRQRLQMLKNTQANLRKLTKRNEEQKQDQGTRIELPVMLATNNFDKISLNFLKQEIKLQFPEGTQFINNVLAHPLLFSSSA